MKFNTALYIRLSREDGDKKESDSILNQKHLLMNYISRNHDLQLYDIYIDDGYSGTNFSRPGFQAMLAAIYAGKVNCVIVKDLSRFGRDYLDTGKYLERDFPALGVRFISVTEQIDSARQSYDLLVPIRNLFNEQYARDISRKIQSTLHEKQRSGEFIGAFACYGYQKSPHNKNQLMIDPYAANIVQQIFSYYIDGYEKQAIADILNSRKIPCPSEYKRLQGKRYCNGKQTLSSTGWTYSTINCILHRQMYTGTMVQGTKRQYMHSPQKQVRKEDWIRVPNTHEAIIDSGTWEKAQSLLTSRTRKTSPSTHPSPFAGLLSCGNCHHAMIRNTWKKANGTSMSRLYCSTYKRNGKSACAPHSIPLSVIEQIVSADILLLIEHNKNLWENFKLNRSMLMEMIQKIEILEDHKIKIFYRFSNDLNLSFTESFSLDV
jgi:DNA invertase Pin-like site-specific DNA recombinase